MFSGPCFRKDATETDCEFFRSFMLMKTKLERMSLPVWTFGADPCRRLGSEESRHAKG